MKQMFCWLMVMLVSGNAWAKTVMYTLPGDMASTELMTDGEGYAHFPKGTLDFPYGEIGAPALPTRTILFAIPAGVSVTDVTVAAEWTVLAENVLLYPFQEPTKGGDSPVFTPPSEAYYSLEFYPEAPFMRLPIAIASGVHMQPVNILPFRYEPLERKLYAATSYVVTVTMDEPVVSGIETKSKTPTTRTKTKPVTYSKLLRTMVSDQVVNADDVDTVTELTPAVKGITARGVVSGSTLPITGTVPDYILISPSSFVSAWTTYVNARAAKFPELDFAVVNADTIYSTYASEGRNDLEKIHAFIKAQAKLGTTYFVLGGQAKPQDWGDDRVNALGQTINRTNSIPTCHNAASEWGNYLSSDMYFACHDIKAGTYPWDSDGNGTYLGGGESGGTVDLVPDCVVTRISVMPYNYNGTGVKTAPQLIAAYTAKLAKGENPNFGGRFKFATGGSTLNYVGYFHENGSALVDELEFYDESYNFYDTRRGQWIDSERQMRWRVPQYYAHYRPVVGGTTIFHGGVWDPDAESTGAARRDFFASDWELLNVNGHGWAMGTSGFDSNNEYSKPTWGNVRVAEGLTKIYLFLLPCDTGAFDYYNNESIPCLGESSVNNPVGGSLFSVHNSHHGWFSDNMGEDGLSSRLDGLMNKHLFANNHDAGTAVMNMRIDYGSGLWNIAGNKGLDCLIEETPMGDPLVRITAIQNLTWTGTKTGTSTWSTNSTGWNSSSGKYDHADTTAITTTGNKTFTVNEKLSTRYLDVTQSAGNTFTLSGTGSMKAVNGLTVSAGNLNFGIGGGVGGGWSGGYLRNGIKFTSPGNLTLSGTSYCYVGSVNNANAVVVTGANTVFDLGIDTNPSDNFSALSYSGAGVATSVNNILRSRSSDALASFGTVPVSNSELVLQTFNIGGTAGGGSVLFAATNSTIKVQFNPGWDSEYFTRPVRLNNSTLRNEYKYFALGNSTGGGFNLIASGSGKTSTLSDSGNGIPLNGTLRLTADSGATLNVTARLKDGNFSSGLVKDGAGAVSLSAINTYSGNTVVSNGTLTATTADSLGAGTVTVKSDGTLKLDVIPLKGVTALVVEAGGTLILPASGGTGFYQVLKAGGAVLTVNATANVYEAPNVTTKLVGKATSTGAYVLTATLLNWVGDANGNGTWANSASYTPWNITPKAAFANGGKVEFSNLGSDVDATVTVVGSILPTLASFENTTTAYTFVQGGSGTVGFNFLQTFGPTTFNVPLTATNGVIVAGGNLVVPDLKTPFVQVGGGARFKAGTLGSGGVTMAAAYYTFDDANNVGANSVAGATTEWSSFNVAQVSSAKFGTGAGQFPASCLDEDFGADTSLNYGHFTISMHVKGGSLAWKDYISFGTSSSQIYLEQAGNAEAGKLAVYSEGSPGGATPGNLVSSKFVNNNAWHHIGLVGDGATLKLYVDGVSQGSTAYTGSGVITSIKIGGRLGTDGRDMTADIDDVGFWTVALSAADMASLAANSIASLEYVTVTVDSGAELVASGSYSVALDLAMGSKLVGISDGVGLVNNGKLAFTGASGTITVDTASMTKQTGSQPILTAANLTIADMDRFSCNTSIAVLKIVDHTLYAVTDGFLSSPYTRTFSGNANWNTSGWFGNGVAFTTIWSQTDVNMAGAANLTVSGNAVLTVDTPVRLGSVTATGAGNLTLALSGSNSLGANNYNFASMTGASTVNFGVGAANVTCGSDTTVGGGSGTLTIGAGKKGTLKNPWTGPINNSGTLVYSGTQSGVTPQNTGTVMLDTTLAFGGYTWNGSTLTLTPNAKVTLDGNLTIGRNHHLTVNGGTLNAGALFPASDSSSSVITFNNGAQVTLGTLRPAWYNPSVVYYIDGPGTLLKVGTFGGDNNLFNGVYPMFHITNGAELSLGKDIDTSGNGIGIANLRFTDSILSAYANWGFSTTETLNNRIVDGKRLTINPAAYTIDYNQVIGQTGSALGGGRLVIGRAGATGTVNLSGVNTYSGGTVVSNGTLQVANVAALGTGNVVLAGGKLKVDAVLPNAKLAANPVGELVATISSFESDANLIKVDSAFTSVPSSGFTVTLTAGTTTKTVTRANLRVSADGQYLIYSASTVGKIQTITFGTLPVKTIVDTPFTVTATASSGLTVSLSSSNPSVATVSGKTITIVGAGETMITASQAGNSTYAPALDVQQTLTVNSADVSGVWINASGGAWPTNSNWSGNLFASGVGNTADFSTLNLTADATVTLDGALTIGHLQFGDTVASHNWTLNSGSAGPLTLEVSSGTPTVTVGNQSATIEVDLAGTNGLTKAGAGTLLFNNRKAYTGGTIINGGVLDLTGGGGQDGTLRGSVKVNAGGTLQLSTGDATGYGIGDVRISKLELSGGSLNVNSTANQTISNTEIVMTGGTMTGIAGSNIDLFNNGTTISTLASATESVISTPTMRLRQNDTQFNVANGEAPVDLRISAAIGSGDAGNKNPTRQSRNQIFFKAE